MNRHPRSLQCLGATVLALSLTACGAEVAGTAAAVGKLQAQQLEQAKADQAKILDGMKQAEQAAAARAASAGEQ